MIEYALSIMIRLRKECLSGIFVFAGTVELTITYSAVVFLVWGIRRLEYIESRAENDQHASLPRILS